jgi:hypothetical protein
MALAELSRQVGPADEEGEPVNASDDNSRASDVFPAESLAELLSDVLGLIDRAANGQYTAAQLQTRRARIEQAAEQALALHDLSPATAARDAQERRLATAANSSTSADIAGYDAELSNGQTQRLTAKRLSAERSRSPQRRPNSSPGGLFSPRRAPAPARQSGDHWRIPASESSPVRRLHDLAQQGRLAETAAAAHGEERRALTGAAYDMVWPIVYARVTRQLEQRRGHATCAAGVSHLTDECLDRFHDDVEAVVEDLLTHAQQPIRNLEAWITTRLTRATVDSYRRRRGLRGALQRPRLPIWIAYGLSLDPWLTVLGMEILIWVAVGSTTSSEVWPLEAWAQKRAQCTGDWTGSDPDVVAREVKTVLAVMRRRPAWYESYIERPLGTKQASVTAASINEDEDETIGEMVQVEPTAHINSELLRQAAEAVQVIDARIATGEQAERVVVEVIRAFFGASLPAGHAPEPLVSAALADVNTVNRIVSTVLEIISERERGPADSCSTDG